MSRQSLLARLAGLESKLGVNDLRPVPARVLACYHGGEFITDAAYGTPEHAAAWAAWVATEAATVKARYVQQHGLVDGDHEQLVDAVARLVIEANGTR